jgi:hypothetical protein
MESLRVRNRLIAALVCCILLVGVAGVFSVRIGEETGRMNHEMEHLRINHDLLKFQLDHLPGKK